MNKNRRSLERGFSNKKIIYVLVGVLLLLLVGIIVYLIVINKNEVDNNLDNNTDTSYINKDISISYVSCDDNTANLNVRSTVGGNIIDSLSCYQVVNVEEELEGDSSCDTWYRISYNKRKKDYTGYACGLYIKKDGMIESTYKSIKELIDKAIDYYDTTLLKPYCNATEDELLVEVKTNDGSISTKRYVKSKFKSIEEIKNYLSTFIDISLFNLKLEVSDINNPRLNDNYYIKDDNLYCRDYSSNEVNNNYTDNYNIEIISSSDNKTVVNISYEYLNEKSKCNIDNLDKCLNSDFIYDIGMATIENGIITKIDFHK